MSEGDKKNEVVENISCKILSCSFFSSIYEFAFLEARFSGSWYLLIRDIRVSYERGLLTVKVPDGITLGYDLDYALKMSVCDWLEDNPLFKQILVENTSAPEGIIGYEKLPVEE